MGFIFDSAMQIIRINCYEYPKVSRFSHSHANLGLLISSIAQNILGDCLFRVRNKIVDKIKDSFYFQQHYKYQSCIQLYVDTSMITNTQLQDLTFVIFEDRKRRYTLQKNNIFQFFLRFFNTQGRFLNYRIFSPSFYLYVANAVCLIVAFNKIIIAHWCVPTTFVDDVIDSFLVFLEYLTYSLTLNRQVNIILSPRLYYEGHK